MTEEKIQGKIAQANGRLRAGKIGIAIYVRRNKLFLRGVLPPKATSNKSEPHQQWLPTGIPANFLGVSAAEKLARKVGAQLINKEFSWEPYLKTEGAATNVTGDWVKQFEQDYFRRRERNGKTEATWRGDYLKVLRQLPVDEALTVDLLKKLVFKTLPDTKTRKRTCMVLNALAKFAQLDCDLRPYSGRYSPRRVSPRDLPDDAVIAEWFNKIANPGWRWVYAVIATYGLRPHEAFHLDYDQIREGSLVLSVLDGKTGSRRVWPCYPEWHNEFNIQNIQLPKINFDRSNTAIGGSCTKYFQKLIPFGLYDLRHCWAVRTLEFGLDLTLAAQQMGHSVQMHSETYHHWLTDKHHQRAFEALMMRVDRPKPPLVTGGVAPTAERSAASDIDR